MEKPRLTRKQLVEHIRQTMPQNYNEYEKLAFIEMQVAKYISFDEKYLWGDIGTKEKIYKLAKKEVQKPQEEVKRKLICVTMAELFGYVAKEFGFDIRYQKRTPGDNIKAGDKEIFKEISGQKQEHVCPIVGLSNGQYIEVDIQDDLARLQTHSKPKSFGANRHGIKSDNGVKIEILDSHLVDSTFRKVYQLQEKERFTDEYIMVFSAMLRCQNRTPIEMIEFFMNDPKIQKQLQNTKCIEANKLYKAILLVCYDVKIGKQFSKKEHMAIIDECILLDNEGRKRYSFCVYAEDDEQQKFYVYSKKSKRMVSLSQEEIQQMSAQDMKVQLRGRQSSLQDKMIRFINGQDENTISNKEDGSNISLEDIFFDEDEVELE